MYKIIGWFLQPEPRGGISVRYHPALLGMDAVRVAWPGAVCSFVRDACTHAVKNRLNRACVGDVSVVGF